MKGLAKYYFYFITFQLMAFNAFSAESPVYEDTTGVSMEMNSDGSDWLKIRSVGEATLKIGDRQDVINSTKKATLLAKAEIAKFLNEKVTTSDTVSEITKTLSENNNGIESVNRKNVETLVTEIHNSSEAILKGVLVLEQNVDAKNKVVKVTVGLSRNTMATADSLKSSLKGEKPGINSNPKTAIDAEKISDEIRRNKSYDNF
jgi:hypothetical protein